MSTAGETENLHECSCGKCFASEQGVSLCQENGHGSGKDKFVDRYKFRQELVTEYAICCAECGSKLKFRVVEVNGSRTAIDVLPHVCAVG
jgi:hypothetical protein